MQFHFFVQVEHLHLGAEHAFTRGQSRPALRAHYRLRGFHRQPPEQDPAIRRAHHRHLIRQVSDQLFHRNKADELFFTSVCDFVFLFHFISKESFARQSKNLLAKWPAFTRRMTIRRWRAETSPLPKSAAFSTRSWTSSLVRCTRKPRPSTLSLPGPASTRKTRPITSNLPYVSPPSIPSRRSIVCVLSLIHI